MAVVCRVGIVLRSLLFEFENDKRLEVALSR